MIAMKKSAVALGLLVALSACADGPSQPTVSYSRPMEPKLALDVQTISLADRTTLQPANSPYNSNQFSPTISDAIKQWASDRMKAVGQTGNAIVVIKDATLTSQPLRTDGGFDSWFTRQQSVRYTGRAEVSIEANGRSGFAMADGVATRSVTLPEDPTPAERKDAYTTLLNGLIKDLSQNLDSAMQSHMGNFIVSAPSPIFGSTAIPAARNAVAPAPMDAAPTAGSSADSLSGASAMADDASSNAVQETQTVAQPASIRPMPTAAMTTGGDSSVFIPLSGPTR